MMPQILEIYKCEKCGNIVEMVHEGDGQLVCCGEPMKRFEGKTEDQGKEKHVPVVEKSGSTITVKVGSVPHPMEEKHYIEWIEVIACPKVQRQFLKPGEKPKATFTVEGDKFTVREYCNVHGLWKA